MQIPENILELIQKYQEGSLTNDERAILDNWYQSFEEEDIDLSDSGLTHPRELSLRIRSRIEVSIREENALEATAPVSFFKRYRIPAVAAVLLLVVSAGLYLYLSASEPAAPLVQQSKPVLPPNDLAPGGNKALLTLDDGSTVVLDHVQNGLISEQGIAQVQKLENGQVAYQLQGQQTGAKVYYNTISTPRGGEYQITLSDGTRVWLNAASSIRFPTIFIGAKRSVEITGEVYFEVAHNEHLPFVVATRGSSIEVLGTSFNVNAYEDEEQMSTSLIEGSVRIVPAQGGTPQVLRPGQQARVTATGKLRILNNMDTEEVLGWKNGLFVFNSTDLRSIMRQISRWYDIDIKYNGNVDMHFTGQITRNDNVSKVFEKLELTGELRFRVENDQIIVSR